ncbi:MAG: Flp pilus assembly protein CpaB [Actinomycetes bacterium]
MVRPGWNWWRELRRAATWHRRLLAAGLAAAAVAVGLQVLRPPPPPTVEVLAAARDIDAGAALVAGDVVALTLPSDAVPSGALDPAADVTGRAVAGPIRAGEPITDVRLVGPALVAGLGEGLVATPVRVADAGTAGLVRPGDRVDVLATPVGQDTTGQPSRIVAAEVVVIAVPGTDGAGFVEGALLVLATTPEEAAGLAAATVTDRLSLTLRG